MEEGIEEGGREGDRMHRVVSVYEYWAHNSH